jgi:heme a synthase
MNTDPVSSEHKSLTPIILWLFTGCFLIFLMVIIGGITRLTHSGLSITEWNLLMGTLPPLNEGQWLELFEKYKQSPEFREMHYYFTLSDFKSIFWWEYIHRLLGRLIGIVFIVPFIYFLVKQKIPSGLLPKLIVLFLLGAFQGFLGWFMVKSGLVDRPAVSHYRLAAHLLTAFATFGYTFWIALGLISFKHTEPFSPERSKNLIWPRRLAAFLFSIVVIQIIFGAFVAGLKAGYIYPTFPKMGQDWIAEEIKMNFSEFGWISFVQDGASVQFVHRWLAILILVAFWMVAKRIELPFRVNLGVRILMVIVLLQFTLGLLTLLYSMPLHLAVLHQAGAFFLFGGILYLLHGIKQAMLS